LKNLWPTLRLSLLGLPPEETGYERRGFRGATGAVRNRLEQIGAAFMAGYHAALQHGTPLALAAPLNAVEAELRGFAFEGAAMGLALLDLLTPWAPTRVSRFLSGAGAAHAYMVHVGVGWVWARFPYGFRRRRRRLEPLLSWLAFDGWGFHEGFFHWPEYLAGQGAPRRLHGYERRAFDQGLGRSLWFVNGGNPELIASSVGNLAEDRRTDLWSGVGLAATYAGIVSREALETLHRLAGKEQPALAQGSAFAAKARQRAGNPTEYTDVAVRVLAGLSAQEASRLCDATVENLPANGGEPVYEVWRQRLQTRLQIHRPLQLV
jgi:enediyne biosynthesis protein E3